nr:MAE_28990/MAE_18760 family HEPN-like nuclease [uncultured Macellibacteroides sp.]
MTTVDNLFMVRKEEIELFFKYLTYFNNSICKIQYESDRDGISHEINLESDFFKILKANGYLLLYNLIEAVVEKSLDITFKAINEEQMSYTSTSDSLRKLCIKLHSNKIREINKSKSISTEIKGIIDYFINSRLIELSKDLLSGRSGNLDSKKINEILMELGMTPTNFPTSLRNVKQKRNNLAHGNISFTDGGKDVVLTDLVACKDEVINYLDDFINKVRQYVNYKEYIATV